MDELQVLTPNGPARAVMVDAQKMIQELVFSDGTRCRVAEQFLRTPLLRHFPDDDPVEQYRMWRETDAVIDVFTLRLTSPCRCPRKCPSCGFVGTCAWLLGHAEPTLLGTSHNVYGNGLCRCPGDCACRTTNDLPEPTIPWFLSTLDALVEVGTRWS